MPLFLSEIDGTFQVAFNAASNKMISPGQVCSLTAKQFHDTVHHLSTWECSMYWLQFRPSETHPNCNISRVDTHCKHQLHCTECPFTGDDVYRRFIFNLLSPILMKRDGFMTQINKWINPLHDHAFFFFSFLLCDYWGMRGLLLRIHNKTVDNFYSVLKEK